jgi:hypothetical protein
MMTDEEQNLGRSWPLLFARLVLGLIFFMAGAWKVFQLGPLHHARKYFLPFADTFLPVWSLWLVGASCAFVDRVFAHRRRSTKSREATRKNKIFSFIHETGEHPFLFTTPG